MSTEKLTQCARAVLDAWGDAGWTPAFDAARRALRAEVEANEALAAVPVEPPAAWQVWWGLGYMRLNSVHIERKTAEEAAATIKSYTEIRPLYTHPAPQPQQALQTRLDDYATEINRLRNVIQAACIGGTDYMIERWKQLFPDAPVPTVKPQQAGRDCPHCNYSGTAHCGDVAAQIKANGGEPGNCSNAHAYGLRVATPPQPTAPALPTIQDLAAGALYPQVSAWSDSAPATQAQVVSQWLPIESAPKNGTEILVWWAHPTKDQPGVSLSHWLDNSKTATPWAGWALPKVIVPGMYVSHWMHKPGCPASAAQKEST